MRKTRAVALFMAALMVLSVLPVPALADGGTVYLSTPEELLRFAERCRLDSWSRGKTFVLKNDIDLTGYDFSPVPSFGGTFEGGGHTISGLCLTDTAYDVSGLFRYVQSGAVIRELSVSGSVSGDGGVFGGVAGENSGKIINCSFDGSVSGSSDIGGVAGVNTATGELYGCVARGSVTGGHYTGGIAGRNLGTVISCTNLSWVNTTDVEVEPELSLDLETLGTTESFPSHTDTGGIVGFSQGVVQSCVNRGSVGYPHVGYNVGGVAGRQSGYLYGCENYGAIYGRKDVGGIVGQMVPAIDLQLSAGGVQELRAEMDALRTLIDGALTDFENVSAEASAILTQAGDYLDSAGESAAVMGGALTDFVNDNVDSVNTFTATAARYVEKLSPILEDLESGSARFTDAAGSLAKALEELNGDREEAAAILGYVNNAVDCLTVASDCAESAGTLARQALEQLRAALEGGADGEELKALALDSAEKIKTAVELLAAAGSKADEAVEEGVSPALAALEDFTLEMGDVIGPLENAAASLAGAGSAVTGAVGGLGEWAESLAAEEPVRLSGLGTDFSESASRLDASLAGLSGEMEKLNGALTGGSTALAGDLRQVNQQFFRVMDSFASLLDGSGSDLSGIYEDVSDEEVFSAREGKAEGCVNSGSVDGDVNVGGIAGTMSIEYDLDPEEDITVSGSGSAFRYLTMSVLLDCVNRGGVESKKNCAGGVVGNMDLGTVYGCENYGSVASRSGDYVGGIAGQSAAGIRSAYALCTLSGRNYVGGIAGSGTDIVGCRAIVEISAGDGWLGAIAGEALGECSENYFVGSGLGGVDGVSYAGRAEPLDYADFSASGDLPAAFSDFSLSFVAEGSVIGRVSFEYGGSIDPEDIPAVPEKAGYVGQWEDCELSDLTFSGTVEAVYTPYATVVASAEKRGEKPLVLLEGSFLPGSVPSLSKSEESRGAFGAVTGAAEAWTVSADGSTGGDYLVRFLLPEGMESAQIWLLSEGRWSRVESGTDGSYLVFEAGGGSFSFCCAEAPASYTWAALPGAAAALALLLAAVLRCRAVKRKKRGEKARV